MFYPLRQASLSLVVAGLLGSCLVTTAIAQDTPSAPDDGQRFFTVEEKPLRIEVELEGISVANKTTEITLRPKSWSQFIVLEAASHGARVNEGDVLVRCESDKLERAITDLGTALELSELEIKQAEQEIPLLEQSLELARADAQRAYRIAKEDTERQLTVEGPMDKKRAKYQLKEYEFALESALEELNQLQKMYDADDLTEETEEMILRRQKHRAEQAQFSLERAKLRHEESLKLSIPREEESAKHRRKTADSTFAKKQLELQYSLKQKQFEVAKKKREHERSKEKLEKLQADKELLVVRSPSKGVVYYGQEAEGKWSSTSAVAKQLAPHGKLSANEVLMTIVQPEGVHVLASVPQSKLALLRPGQDAVVSFEGLDLGPLLGRVEQVSEIPVQDGKFSARLNLQQDGRVVRLVAGMTCKARPKVYQQEKAIMIPTSAIGGHSNLSKRRHVTLITNSGKQERRTVQIGHQQGDLTEIIQGLKPGETILKTNKDKQSAEQG